MELTVWTYEGPPHVGAMRVATAMRDVHYVLHAPQGDTYADLLFTMIERRRERPPVTYTTFQARDLGGDTASLFQNAVREAHDRFAPAAMLVGASCTGELIQDDPAGLAAALALPVPVVPLELPSYQRKENWGAAETFYQLVRSVARPTDAPARQAARAARERATCNLLGPTALGFRHKDDVAEIRRLLTAVGVDVAVVAPLDACVADLARLPEADFNVVLYPETGEQAAAWLERRFGQPAVRTVPLGVGATRRFVAEVAALAGLDPEAALARAGGSRQTWYTQSVDSTYLTGKRVFVFGDATHAVAAARIARDELGFDVVGLGTYSREFAREVRAMAAELGIEPLITDDYLDVEARVAELRPELVLGTQMERHIAKRLRLPCAVISAPVHVQDFPARHAPQMGFEGASVLFDTWVQPLMMGLEEHLLTMFRGDFEFHDGAAPSHLGASAAPLETVRSAQGPAAGASPVDPAVTAAPTGGPVQAQAASAGSGTPVPGATAGGSAGPRATGDAAAADAPGWEATAELELRKIPFFVRGKARRNTERFALERGLATITVETLYDAKAHFAR